MLTDAQRADVRRYCGYPMYGGQPTQAFGWRFYQWYGTLEFRLVNALPEEYALVTTMLTRLNALETALAGSTDNLDTASAGPWVHNASEIKDRTRLYTFYRKELCNFIGVPPGPYFQPGDGAVRMVV